MFVICIQDLFINQKQVQTGLGGGQFTEEFKQYAADSGLNIVDALAADGPQLLSVQEGSPIATTPGYLPSAPTSGELDYKM